MPFSMLNHPVIFAKAFRDPDGYVRRGNKRTQPENTMNTLFLDSLKVLQSDPSRVIDFYDKLYHSSYVAMVQRGTEHEVSSMLFLTYNRKDEVWELPIFTKDEFMPEDLPFETCRVPLKGQDLFPRLLDVMMPNDFEIAVDPCQPHGVRLTREMVQGMVSGHRKSA